MKSTWKSWFTPILFIAVMAALIPVVDRFEFDEDEGVELMKGKLVAQGHDLYSEIWDDQPPLLSILFGWLFRLCGENVMVGRGAVLVFSALLLWSWQSLALMLGNRTLAVATVLTLVTLPAYLQLSMSAMAGLPAIALMSAALAAQVTWHRTGSLAALIASGILLALAVLTKLFTGLLAPIFLAGILLTGYRERRLPIKMAFLWGISFSAILGLCALWLLPPESWEQLTGPHAAARSVEAFQGQHWLRGFNASTALLGLAAAGTFLALRERRWLWLYPLLWAGVGLVLLLSHQPVWYHQRLLVAVPSSILAAAAVTEAFRSFRPQASLKVLGFSLAGIVLLGLMAGQHWPPLRNFLAGGDSGSPLRTGSDRIVSEIVVGTEPDDWVVTDRPMFAFRAGANVPPGVAVLTSKRLLTGWIDEASLQAAIVDYQVEAVYLDRFPWPQLSENLAEDFDGFEHGELGTLYFRKGVSR